MSGMNELANVEDLFPEVGEDTTVNEEITPEEGNKQEEGDVTKQSPQPALKPMIDASVEDLFPEDDKGNDDSENDNSDDGSNNDNSEEIDNEETDDKYSELSRILYEEGVLDNLDEEDLKNIKDADDFKALITEQINRGLNERQQEINEALSVGVEPSIIQTYASAMQTLNSWESMVEEESEEGKKIRANLIYQDYINKGIKENKARSLLQASMSAGSDIEDAKEALESLKEYYSDGYKTAVEEAKQEELERQEFIKKQDSLLKKNLLEKNDLFGGIELDKNTRQKAYNAVAKVTAKDDKGKPLTAVQKYAQDNPTEFRSVLGLIYAVTDGFTNLSKFFNKAVNKKVNSKLDDFTRKLSSSGSQKGEGGIGYSNRNDGGTQKRWRVYL